MKVSDFMSANVTSVTPTTPLNSVFSVIFQKKINAVPVVDAKKKLVGIITKDDLLQMFYPNMIDFLSEFTDSKEYQEMEKKLPELKNKKAADVMCARVIFTRYDTPAMRALSRMLSQRVNQLPVLDDTDSVVGMLTKGDVFSMLFKKSHPPKAHAKAKSK